MSFWDNVKKFAQPYADDDYDDYDDVDDESEMVRKLEDEMGVDMTQFLDEDEDGYDEYHRGISEHDEEIGESSVKHA